jgi:hypothetical protein
MTFRRPPVVASWLLAHLTNPDEGLVGDLIEEYQRHAARAWYSRAWYWRQVAIAITVGFVRGVWTYKLETVQAVFTGFAAMGVFYRIAISPALMLLESLAGARPGMPPGSWHSIYMWVGAVFWFVAACCTGRLIARLHPPHRATMVLANVMFLFAWNLPEWYRTAGNAMSHDRYSPYFFNSVMWFLLVGIGIMLGGLWASSDKAQTTQARAKSI